LIYIIKFLYSFVLPPGLFIVLLFGMTVWLWRSQFNVAMVLLAITLLLYISSISIVSNILIGSLERQYPQPTVAELQGDVIVVLGAGASKGTPDIDGTGNMYGSAGNRLITAARLHRITGLPILFSGGQVFSDSGNEADIAKRQLLGMGVEESKLMVENRSLNTAQNANNTAVILKQKGLSHPILVTSGFHLPRSVMQFKRVGLTVQPFPTDYWVSQPSSMYFSKFYPSASAMSSTATAIKEYLGMLAVKIKN